MDMFTNVVEELKTLKTNIIDLIDLYEKKPIKDLITLTDVKKEVENTLDIMTLRNDIELKINEFNLIFSKFSVLYEQYQMLTNMFVSVFDNDKDNIDDTIEGHEDSEITETNDLGLPSDEEKEKIDKLYNINKSEKKLEEPDVYGYEY